MSLLKATERLSVFSGFDVDATSSETSIVNESGQGLARRTEPSLASTAYYSTGGSVDSDMAALEGGHLSFSGGSLPFAVVAVQQADMNEKEKLAQQFFGASPDPSGEVREEERVSSPAVSLSVAASSVPPKFDIMQPDVIGILKRSDVRNSANIAQLQRDVGVLQREVEVLKTDAVTMKNLQVICFLSCLLTSIYFWFS